MAENSNIDWTDDSGNSWGGCIEVRLVINGKHIPSECDNCYAKWLMFNRMGYNEHDEKHPVLWGNPKTTPRIKFKYFPKMLPERDALAKSTGRRLVFLFSLSDWAEEHPMVGPWRNEMFDLIERCPNLDFQMLTKRPQNVRRMLPQSWLREFPQNVWLGTSAGTQAAMNRRAPYLGEFREMGAPVAFISIEPLLGVTCPDKAIEKYGANWLITGGESGPGIDRPRITADTAWFRLVRDTAIDYGVPFFHKQSGGPKPGTGKELDGRVWHQWPNTYLGKVGGVRAMSSAELIKVT